MSASEARGPAFGSYAAIGDSFTEGMGDERPDGAPRGWADLVAAALAQLVSGVGDVGDGLFGSYLDRALNYTCASVPPGGPIAIACTLAGSGITE